MLLFDDDKSELMGQRTVRLHVAFIILFREGSGFGFFSLMLSGCLIALLSTLRRQESPEAEELIVGTNGYNLNKQKPKISELHCFA